MAVTGDGVTVQEEALLLLSAEDVSDGGVTTTGKRSGSHFPVIINTHAIYNNEDAGRRHMMYSEAHLTCDYQWWPAGDAAARRFPRR